MINFIKEIIAKHPILYTLLVLLIGTLIERTAIDVYGLIKKGLYHTGLFIKGLWRAGLREKRTMTRGEVNSQNQWKEEQK